MQVTVHPQGFGQITGSQFDIKRTIERATWAKDGTWVQNPGSHRGPGWDDDPHDQDEDLTPSQYDHIYSIDSPGWAYASESAYFDESVHKLSAVEFVKVKFGNGGWIKCSDDYLWHSIVWLENNEGTWQRKSGENKVDPGAITIGTSNQP